MCTSCHGLNETDQAGHAAPMNEPEALRQLLIHWRDNVATQMADEPEAGDDGAGGETGGESSAPNDYSAPAGDDDTASKPSGEDPSEGSQPDEGAETEPDAPLGCNLGFGALPEPGQGIMWVCPAPGTSEVSTQATLAIALSAPSYMAYTTGRLVRVMQVDTGAQVAAIDFESGDAQEGSQTLLINLAELALQPHTTYMIKTDPAFTLMHAEPWSAGAIPAGAWTFTTQGLLPGPLAVATPGIQAVYPAPGSDMVPLHESLAIQLTGPSYMAYTANRTLRVRRVSDGIQVGPSIDFEAGDPQEWSETLSIPLVTFGLEPNTTYEVVADYAFTGINVAPWKAGAIAGWTFTTANP